MAIESKIENSNILNNKIKRLITGIEKRWKNVRYLGSPGIPVSFEAGPVDQVLLVREAGHQLLLAQLHCYHCNQGSGMNNPS